MDLPWLRWFFRVGELALLGCFAARAQAAIPTTYPTGAGPATVGVGRDGKLTYTYEANGDRIPDFSNCGYRSGGVPIPDVPVKVTLTPVTGDNAPQIQAAVNSVAAMPLDASGFRGAVLLKAGVYEIASTITIKSQGVVLRGEGSGTNGTILRSTSGSETVTISGSGSRSKVSGTTHNVTNTYVPVGATWLTLDSVSGLSVGDTIIVHRPQTQAWVDYIGQTDHFQSGDANLDWDRVITEIDGTRIRFDAPITEALDAQWGGGTVYKYTWSTRLINCGVEDIRADCTVGTDDLGNTSGSFMTLSSTANCWVRRCYNDKMRGHTLLCSGSKWNTFEDITSYHNPLPGAHSGASTQIFAGSFSELLLFHRIIAYSGGFEFSGGRQNSGPVAWVECQVPKGFAFSGPHEQWNMGYLWDSLFMAHSLAVIEQGKGMTGANHLAWNCESTSTFNFERVLTTHQWIQGCIGDALPTPKNNGPPEVLSYGTHLQPGSLYRAQLDERVGQMQEIVALGPPAGSTWYQLTASPASATVQQGQNGTATINLLTSSNYGGQPISFSCSGLPTGATASFAPSSLNSPGSTQLTIVTRSATPVGTYNVGVTGAGSFPTYAGGTQIIKRSVFVTLTVTKTGAPPPPPPTDPLLFEAESLTIAGTSGDSTAVLTEAGLSGGKGIQLFSNAVGDYIAFIVPSVPAWTYDVRIGVKKYRPRAIVQTRAGPAGGTLTNLGATMDLYGSNTVYTEFDLGNWSTAIAGNKWFEFDAVGKNSSSSDYNIVIDYIKLIPQQSSPAIRRASR